MTWNDIVVGAQALLADTGLTQRANALEKAVKSRVLRAHPWEHLLKTGQITYTAGSESISLDTNAYRKMFRLISIRINGETVDPPDYVTEAEWSRQKALGGGHYTNVMVWTQIGRSFFTLAALGKTYDVTYMRDPADVGWGEVSEELFDFAVLALARMLCPAQTKTDSGVPVPNPTRRLLKAEEEEALQELLDVEYRQPGRDYKVRPDRAFELRVQEEY